MKDKDIKPIETSYDGYRFRSRLEAKWAVFFNALYIKYEYEPEGFNFDGEWYLPDFYLPDYNIYVEVKPAHKQFITWEPEDIVSFGDEKKYGLFAARMAEKGAGVWFVFGDPFDAILINSFGAKGNNDLFFMGECIPKAFYGHENVKCFCGGKERNSKDCDMKARYCGAKIICFGTDFAVTGDDAGISSKTVKIMPFGYFDEIKKTAETVEDKANAKKVMEIVSEWAKETLNACKTARQARFEHGETPTI